MSFYIEIKKAVGGLESSIFVEELFNLYACFIKNYHIIHYSRDKQGMREISLLCSNDTIMKYFANEDGTHRVQRVPNTESNGRIQTSTCIVNVYEATKKESVSLSNKDIRTDTFRSSGAGGQHVNKTNSAIRLTHLPTGISCTCQAERSQAQNKRTAMRMLSAKLSHYLSEETQRVKNHTRQTKIYHAQRNNKIKTYNFLHNTITDHRKKTSAQILDKVFKRNDFMMLFRKLYTR
ncbi:peptide chain release factor-like protein [Candidatus Vidania fulgoroideorum]